MKALLILLSALALMGGGARAQISPDADGSTMKAEDIARQWQKQPATASPSRNRTRGLTRGASAPASASAPRVVRTRGAGMSQQAIDANEAALRVLNTRGVKVLHGQEAASAQAAQDQTKTVIPTAAASSEAAPSAPHAFIQVPIIPEKRIAFRLRFKKDTTDLADAASEHLVFTIAKAMTEMPATYFMLEGHTCDLGSNGHNQTLSEGRALRIRSLLGEQGIDSKRLLAVGFGETQCELPNTTESDRAQNRRVVIGPIELSQAP